MKRQTILRVLWLATVAFILWLARVPYRLKEIEARECEPGKQPTLLDILREFADFVRSRKLDALKEHKPTPVQAQQIKSLKAILDLSKEKAKDGFDRLDSIEKKVGILFAVDGLLISLCAFLIERNDARILPIALLLLLVLSFIPLVEYYSLNKIPTVILNGPILGDDDYKRLSQLIEDYDNVNYRLEQVGNYLADLFAAARKFVCSALFVAAISAVVTICHKPRNDLVERIRADQNLIRLLQGPRGPSGPIGPKGDPGVTKVIYITNIISGNANKEGYALTLTKKTHAFVPSRASSIPRQQAGACDIAARLSGSGGRTVARQPTTSRCFPATTAQRIHQIRTHAHGAELLQRGPMRD